MPRKRETQVECYVCGVNLGSIIDICDHPHLPNYQEDDSPVCLRCSKRFPEGYTIYPRDFIGEKKKWWDASRKEALSIHSRALADDLVASLCKEQDAVDKALKKELNL